MMGKAKVAKIRKDWGTKRRFESYVWGKKTVKVTIILI